MELNHLWQHVEHTLSIEAETIKDLSSTVDKDQVLEVINVIKECNGRIIVAGCGTSGVAAKKIVHTLCCIERPAVYLNPSDAVHGELGLVQKGDIVILVSKGGKTGELVSLLPALKEKGVHIITVTENLDSILAKEAATVLKIQVKREPDPFNMLATASTLAVIAIFDAIIISLMHEMNYTKDQFAVIHPGGAVGELLLNKG
jgi:KpsF/GutQ family protein